MCIKNVFQIYYKCLIIIIKNKFECIVKLPYIFVWFPKIVLPQILLRKQFQYLST